MSKIFISYARSDGSEVAEFLFQRLSDCGYDVWIDKHGIQLGASFSRAISNALEEECDVIVLLSQAALKSTWVGSEIEMAVTAERRVIPVLLEGVEEDNIPLMMRKLNWLEMKAGVEDWEALNRLVDHLEDGKSIPRVYNLSGHKDFKVREILVLGHSDFVYPDLSDSAAVIEASKKLAQEVLPYIKIGAGIVPPGHPAIASSTLAVLLGTTNEMPKLFYTFKDSEGKFGIHKEVFIALQDLRDSGFAYRSQQ
jgi:hypothetical protein